MSTKRNVFLLPLSIAAITASTILGSIANAGSQGVDIYCVMRNGGNDHEASWQAAYIALKNERGGIFKISPKQAATIIVQQVVGNRENYQECVKYLGDLYPKNDELPGIDADERNPALMTKPLRSKDGYMNDRYSY